jgi:hypothetical protein
MSALLTYIHGFGNFCQAFRPIANEKVFHGPFSLIFRRDTLLGNALLGTPLLNVRKAAGKRRAVALTRHAV